VPARSLALLLLTSFVGLAVLMAQESQRPEAPADTFSGNIVELLPDKVTVSRTILGGHAEKRTFLLKPETKIEGKLKMKAKVTVGFAATDEGDVARLIMVREPKK
jgi:hypothetical protein